MALFYATKLIKTLRRIRSCILPWSLAICLFVFEANGQGYAISIRALDQAAEIALQKLENKQWHDSTQLTSALQQMVDELRSKGYVMAEFQEIGWTSDSLTGQLVAGSKKALLLTNEQSCKKYKSWEFLENQAGFGSDLQPYLNNGYPFARLYFKEAAVSNDTIYASMDVEKGPLILFDSLALPSNVKSKAKFLQKYLFVSKGSLYSEKAFQGISARINNTGYLRVLSSPRADFFAEKVMVSLDFEELQVNQIDGVIGFLPDQNSETGKLLLTGEVETDLYNLFGSGKHAYINWQSFNVASQRLNIAYDHPVILGSPLDFHGSFQQLKQDSSFVTRSAQGGFTLPMSYFWKFGFGLDFRRNSLLSPSAFSPAEKLVNIDSRLNLYTASISYSHLDDIVLPTSGLSLGMNTGFGQKEIIRNTSVDPALYEDIAIKTLQTNLEGFLENYIKVFKSSVFVQQLYAGSMINKQVFKNDLFRIGGLKRLRGFNENQFYAQHYGVGVAEFRFLFQEQSYFVSFIDQAIINSEEGSLLYAVGLGTGMVLKVNNGIFRLMLAVGGSKNEPFDVTQPKVHFGFVNRF